MTCMTSCASTWRLMLQRVCKGLFSIYIGFCRELYFIHLFIYLTVYISIYIYIYISIYISIYLSVYLSIRDFNAFYQLINSFTGFRRATPQICQKVGGVDIEVRGYYEGEMTVTKCFCFNCKIIMHKNCSWKKNVFRWLDC